jgi:glycosyltransferase involved in cell wall biosynthesis
LEWAREFHPDVIYCLSRPFRPIRLQNRLADELGVPMLPHVMDDFMSQMYRNNWLENGPRQALKRSVGGQVRRCPFALAISPAMAAEYTRRFGKPFFPLMNCVDVPTSWMEPPAENGETPLSIAYVGGLHLGRFESLVETAAVVKNLRGEGMRVEIVAYELGDDQEQRAALERTGTVKLAGPLPGQEALRLQCLQKASVLLHLDALYGHAAMYSRLSLSTKLPFYLAAGRAILARAAAGSAPIDYLAEHQAAVTVTDPSPERLQDALQMLLTNQDLRHRLGWSAWLLARARHDASGQRERFRLLLTAAAERRLPGPELA